MPVRDLSVSQQELAGWLTLSARRIRELTRAGVLHKDKQYSLRASVRSYIQFLRSEPGSLTAERERLTKFQADMAEVKFQEQIGELVRRDAVEKAVFASNRRVRTELQNIPSRTSGILAAETNQQTIHAIMAKEIHQSLESLSGGSYG
jgi:phage terminase Nu1 subunit (DNA packaging protein)